MRHMERHLEKYKPTCFEISRTNMDSSECIVTAEGSANTGLRQLAIGPYSVLCLQIRIPTNLSITKWSIYLYRLTQLVSLSLCCCTGRGNMT